MKTHTFKGGVHLYDGKELSKDRPIADVTPGPVLVYPMSQHIGAPARPVVSKGDYVLAGQVIGEAGGFVSAPVHASVSGTVAAVEPRRVVTGDSVLSVVVNNDGLYKHVDYPAPVDLASAGSDDIIERIREAGIVGMGGAGFPTAVKLSPKTPEKIEYVIANCAECEPYLTSDYRCMLEKPEQLIGGLCVILSLFPNAVGVLAIEDNKPDCIKLLQDMVLSEPRISVMPLRTKYPQGSERHLIYSVTKRKINSSMLPADAGCIVDNVDTIISIYNAVINGLPLMERIITVTGDAVRYPRNFRVPLGMSFSELLEDAGGFTGRPQKIISGGPMMGFGVFDTDVPATKTSTALLCMLHDEQASMETTPCIHCSRCEEACPSRLRPGTLMHAALAGDGEAFRAAGGLECIECGCCSYVCPAKKPLTQSIKSMRKMELAKKKK